jgi:outer membrane protein OmpA-like peptidoglycan-associated protein
MLLLAALAQAGEVGGGIYGGYLVVPPRLSVDPGFMAGARLRYRWSESWGLELAGGISPAGIDPRLEFLYFFEDPKSTVTPFFGMGPGLLIGDQSTSWLFDVGGGLDVGLAPVLDLRVDLRLRTMGAEQPVIGSWFGVGLQFHTPRVRDTDNDGISDKADGCRDVAEDMDQFQDEDGCPDPDNDGDGVADGSDGCPMIREDMDQFRDEDGCPDPDNDLDGIADEQDGCPLEQEDKDGFKDGDGCPDPDNDNDGFPDERDKAPNEPETFNGFQDKDGAPDEIPQEVRRFQGRIEGIRFKTNSAEIDPRSFAILDEAVAVLQRFPDVRMEVQGHTDDVGDDAANLALSQARAQAVVEYFISKGVAPERLVARGYGETKPEVPNDSKANRARNRRVEFIILR